MYQRVEEALAQRNLMSALGGQIAHQPGSIGDILLFILSLRTGASGTPQLILSAEIP
jgi:hypothetical protein